MKILTTQDWNVSQELVGLKLALKALWLINQHYQVKERGIMMLLIFVFALCLKSSHRCTHGMVYSLKFYL